MRKLINLVQIINRSKVKNIEIVTDSGDDSLLARFYRGLADGSIRTHDDIQIKLYKRIVDTNVINKLKENLYKRLINTVFFIDTNQKSFTDYQKALYYIQKQFTAFYLLSNRGMDKNVIIEIGEPLLKKALEYDFTDIAIGVCRILSSTYALNGKIVKRKKIQKLLYEQLEILQSDIKVRSCNQDIIEEYVRHRGANRNLSKKAEKYYLEFKPIQKLHPTFNISYYFYSLGIFRYSLINDYKNVLNVCNEAIEFFEKKGKGFNLISVIYMEKLNCCIYFKMFEEGETLYKKIQNYTQEGTHNWFKNQELHIKLYLYSGKYEEAYSVILKTMEHPKFKSLLDTYREFWKVCEVFIFILMQLGYVKRREEDGKNKYFRLSAFVNDVPAYSIDKRGMNIPVIIAQILYFIVKRDFDAVHNRMIAIEKYCVRHLKAKDFDYRSYYFIKMLLTLEECGYNKKRVERRIEGFKRKFEQVPPESKNLEIEIMPFEDLLNIVYQLIE